MFWRASEALAQYRILRRHTDRARVEMAFAHHDAACSNQWCGRKAELVRAQQGTNRDIASGAQTAIDLDRNAAAQIVEQQRLLCFSKANFPRGSGMCQAGQRRCAGPAVITGNGDMVCACL